MACWQEECACLELLGLTILAQGGSFQRCLLGRCGKAERERAEFEAGRTQFSVIESGRFAGNFCCLPAKSPARENSLTGPNLGFQYHCLKEEVLQVIGQSLGLGGPVPSRIPHSFYPVQSKPVKPYKLEPTHRNRPHSRDPTPPH